MQQLLFLLRQSGLVLLMGLTGGFQFGYQSDRQYC